LTCRPSSSSNISSRSRPRPFRPRGRGLLRHPVDPVGRDARARDAELGVTLVERTRRVVRFTPLGIRIADKARRILRETEELADMARAAGKPLPASCGWA
jgi:hypothetical protein